MVDRARELETEIEHLRSELSKAEQHRVDFARRAGHDLKAPLRGLRALTSFLREDVGDGLEPEAHGLLARLDDRVEQMELLVAALSNLGRTSDATGSAVETRIDDLVEDAAESARIPPNFTLEIDAAIGEVCVAANPLEECVRHLIENAWQHHGANGDDGTGRIVVTASTTEGILSLVISDDGPGVDPDTVDTLFEPFRIGPPANSTAARRPGMGLAIVSAIADTHDATVAMRSTGPTGTCMEICWPLALPRQR